MGGRAGWLFADARSSRTTPALVVRRLIAEHGARAYQSDPCWRAIIARMGLLSSQVFIRRLSGIVFAAQPAPPAGLQRKASLVCMRFFPRGARKKPHTQAFRSVGFGAAKPPQNRRFPASC